MLVTFLQPAHPLLVRREVTLSRVAFIAGQDEILDLMEVTVRPSPCHEYERKHMINCYPFCADIREEIVAVGTAPVLIPAECIADARYRTAAQPGWRVQADGRLIWGYLERDQAGA